MAFLLAPLVEAIGRHVRAGPTLHADDTPVPVLAPGLGDVPENVEIGGSALPVLSR
jgi:hypothetical protein